jgi:hypothetical protein
MIRYACNCYSPHLVMIKNPILSIIILFLFAVKANAQITILDTKKLDHIKSGTTYVVVKNLNFPGASQYLDVLKKNWTLTKAIQFLSGSDLGAKLTPGDSFLSLEALMTSRYNNGGGAAYQTNTHYYLSFWTCNEKFFKKDRELKQSDEEPIAKVILSIVPEAFKSGNFVQTRDFLNDLDFDGGGALYNWSPGMLKNYVQQLCALLNAGKKVKMSDDITNKEELAKLANTTLYIPDFDLIKYNKFSGSAAEPDDAAGLFEDYHAAYKVVTKDELDKLILDNGKPKYYLLFIKDSSNKIVCVINSATGETIYSRAKSLSYNLKSGDLKDLYKEISK